MRSKATMAAALAVVLWSGIPVAAGAAPWHHGSHRASTQIVWSRFLDQDSGTAAIVTARPDGSHRRQLTHPGNGVQDIDPKVSPDGRFVLVERDWPDRSPSILLVRADGSGSRVLDFGCTDPCAADASPTWAPDGRHVLFTRVVGPFDAPNESARSGVLFRGDLRGKHVRRVSEPGIDGAYEDYIATFAPAGYMVFVRVRNADVRSAVFRTLRNGHTVRLTPWSIDADEAAVSPARSGPTKDLVVFETYGHGPPDGISQAVATVSAACGTHNPCRRRIHHLTATHALPEQNFNPAWSPTGRHIAYVHFSFDPADDPPLRGDIWTMTWRGRDKTPVSASPLFEFRPNWGRVAARH